MEDPLSVSVRHNIRWLASVVVEHFCGGRHMSRARQPGMTVVTLVVVEHVLADETVYQTLIPKNQHAITAGCS